MSENLCPLSILSVKFENEDKNMICKMKNENLRNI